MIKTVLMGILISSALFAGTENMVPSFSDFDTNRDGTLTKPEFDAAQKNRMAKQSESGKMMKNNYMKPSFESMDTDNDTFVDVLEFSEYKALHRAKMRAK